MSEPSIPCPVCHLSFKTELKVTQHLDKCLASQDKDERPSRSQRNKRIAEEEVPEGEGSGLKKDTKRLRKEDQVAAWSGLLKSPSDDKKGKMKGLARNLSQRKKHLDEKLKDNEPQDSTNEKEKDVGGRPSGAKDVGSNISVDDLKWSDEDEDEVLGLEDLGAEKLSCKRGDSVGLKLVDSNVKDSKCDASTNEETEDSDNFLKDDADDFRTGLGTRRPLSRGQGSKTGKNILVEEKAENKEAKKENVPKGANQKLSRKESLKEKKVEVSTKDILSKSAQPLAELLRPNSLDDLFGQEYCKNSDKEHIPKTDIRWLKALIQSQAPLPSIIFWGPPGCGKTTLAKIIAHQYTKEKKKSFYRFITMSACESGVADVKKQAEIARNELKMSKRRTLLFMDEIHRFTKTQQDAFLPIIENGTVVLIGATTENPSFSLNTALLSRCKTVVLEALSAANIRDVLNRGVSHLKLELVMDSGDSANNDLSDTNTRFVHINESALEILSKFADGDARVALNGLQVAVQTFIAQGSRKSSIDIEHIKESLQKVHVTYDRAGDQHYEIISAFHKSIRGSDDSAALYWLTRMLKGGEDPRYVARRLIVIASEDIGLGDPHALLQATAAHQAVLAVGMPECNVVLAQATVYLARARKSVEVYKAMKKAQQEVQQQAQNGLPPVPLHLRNASSKVMKDLGYGLGYLYNPDCKNGEDTNQTYLPEGFKKLDFFDDDDK